MPQAQPWSQPSGGSGTYSSGGSTNGSTGQYIGNRGGGITPTQLMCGPSPSEFRNVRRKEYEMPHYKNNIHVAL